MRRNYRWQSASDDESAGRAYVRHDRVVDHQSQRRECCADRGHSGRLAPGDLAECATTLPSDHDRAAWNDKPAGVVGFGVRSGCGDLQHRGQRLGGRFSIDQQLSHPGRLPMGLAIDLPSGGQEWAAALLGEANRGSRGEKRLGGKPPSTDVEQERTYCADLDEASQQRGTGYR